MFPGHGARLESLRAWSHSLTLLPWGRPMSPGRGRKVPGGWGGNGRGGEGQLGKAQGLRGDKVDVLRERGARDRRGTRGGHVTGRGPHGQPLGGRTAQGERGSSILAARGGGRRVSPQPRAPARAGWAEAGTPSSTGHGRRTRMFRSVRRPVSGVRGGPGVLAAPKAGDLRAAGAREGKGLGRDGVSGPGWRLPAGLRPGPRRWESRASVVVTARCGCPSEGASSHGAERRAAAQPGGRRKTPHAPRSPACPAGVWHPPRGEEGLTPPSPAPAATAPLCSLGPHPPSRWDSSPPRNPAPHPPAGLGPERKVQKHAQHAAELRAHVAGRVKALTAQVEGPSPTGLEAGGLVGGHGVLSR